MPTLTVYGPRRDNGSRWSRRRRRRWRKIWNLRNLSHLRSLRLKDAILDVNFTGDKEDDVRNKEASVEPVQFLDDKSLSSIMREVADNGRKALNILRWHYTGKGKSKIISLGTQLTSLEKETDENVTDYVIRTETVLTALRNAEKTLDNTLIIIMILKGLPMHFDPFSI